MPQISVGTTPVDIAPMSPTRKTIYIRNESIGGQTLYYNNTLAAGMAIANCGYVLSPGEWLSHSVLIDGNEIKQPWACLSDLAGAVVFWKETMEVD